MLDQKHLLMARQVFDRLLAEQTKPDAKRAVLISMSSDDSKLIITFKMQSLSRDFILTTRDWVPVPTAISTTDIFYPYQLRFYSEIPHSVPSLLMFINLFKRGI